jgi:YidC/Oxa1 family membrane protein insertase
MLGSIPIISPVFQALLDALGWILAEIYQVIPNYGVAIIILTLLIKFLLVPLGVKQIKSMQAMQALQPRIKELNKKYKGNKQKAQEETMKLYKEAGVNPLGGCLPVLLQFPILIAMYAVIRMPVMEATPAGSTNPQSYLVMNNHLPVDSQLFVDVVSHQHTGIAAMNLQCSFVQAGKDTVINDTAKNPIVDGKPLFNGRDDQPLVNPDTGQPLVSEANLPCGTSWPSKIPYAILILLMVGSTFYQQRQMQKASPPNAASSQQQTILKVMPAMFGVLGLTFPAGLVLYWTLSNGFQIGQQSLLMRAGHIGPDVLDKRIAENRAKQGGAPAKQGWFARMMEQAQQAQQQPKKPPPKDGPRKPPPKGSGGKAGGTPPSGPRRRPNTGGKSTPKKPPGGKEPTS